MTRLGQKWGAFLKLVGLYLVLFTLFRLGFFGYFFKAEALTPTSDYLKAFILGFRFDLRVAILCALPSLVFATLPYLNWTKTHASRYFWLGFQLFVTAWVLAVFFFDFGHYAYLEGRISTAILENLTNPDISGEMLTQTYNIPLIALAYALLLLMMFELTRRFVFPKVNASSSDFPISGKMLWGRNLILVVLTVFAIYGSLSQYPLRWSAAFFSVNNFVSSLALNPVHYFTDTAMNPNTSYDLDLLKTYLPDIRQHLGLPAKIENEGENPFLRQTELLNDLQLPANTNVVYIVMESYATAKMDLFGNGAKASPEMDRIAKSGWLFRHFYTPTEGTARSMFCTVTGLTDISADSTSSRNPLAVNQNSLINALTQHQKFYFLGGSASWGNIRGVFQNNINDLKIYEEDDFNLPKTDVWGLSDLDLFRESAKILKANAKNGPIFALIQTASFHRPYTIPKDRGQFQIKTLSELDLKRFGFDSNDEYNSFRFSDYSLGEFFRSIEKEDFFNNTLFVIHGDHGLPHREAQHLGKGYKLFSLSRFHVPLILFSKKLGSPRAFDHMVSQMDVLPSIIGLLGVKAKYQGLGRNLLKPAKQATDFAFSYVYYDRPVTKFLYNQRFILTTDKTGEAGGLYEYAGPSPEKDVRSSEPELYEAMAKLLHGYFEGSRYLIHHNPRLDYSQTQD